MPWLKRLAVHTVLDIQMKGSIHTHIAARIYQSYHTQPAVRRYFPTAQRAAVVLISLTYHQPVKKPESYHRGEDPLHIRSLSVVMPTDLQSLPLTSHRIAAA